MVFTLWPPAHLRSLATIAGFGTIVRNSGIVRVAQGGVVKTFRCATQINPMQRVAADCRRNQSTIAIITAASTNYASYTAFYTEAIGQLLRDWWDVDPDTVAEIDDHAMALTRTAIRPDELQRVAESLLKITPIANYSFSRPENAEAFSIRNDWNFREYGWIGSTEFGLLAWEASA